MRTVLEVCTRGVVEVVVVVLVVVVVVAVAAAAAAAATLNPALLLEIADLCLTKAVAHGAGTHLGLSGLRVRDFEA